MIVEVQKQTVGSRELVKASVVLGSLEVAHHKHCKSCVGKKSTVTQLIGQNRGSWMSFVFVFLLLQAIDGAEKG